MMIKVCLLLSFVVLPLMIYCQSEPVEYFITGNSNLYVPVNSPQKGTYPVLGYDDELDPKFLIGGFGIGVTGWKPLGSRTSLKMNAGLARNVYWDEPHFLTENGMDGAGPVHVRSSDFTLGLSGVVHYHLTGKLYAGGGIGARALFHSVAKLKNFHFDVNLVNRHYKPVMPVVPVEVALKSKKLLFSICYEYGLLNRLKGDLGGYRNDRYGLLVFEVGVRVK